ncbi:hypothetical protein K469DRAFT_497627, partial [Zopfia rhizophila CBS 207.26]
EFFKKGTVFKVLWPELANDVTDGMTIATEPRFQEKIFVKIRWFVVVREGRDCCTCLSIQTHGGRGVPYNKTKSHHAIIYTGASPPAPLPLELPRGQELPMGRPIRVIPHRPYDKLDPLSRINFVKLYTVEHSVKVYHFGNVDQTDEWKLIAQ